jgi:hypothetical protein
LACGGSDEDDSSWQWWSDAVESCTLLVVAEQFETLEAIDPGRIDLGLGFAPGDDFKPCGRSDEICGRVAKIFRHSLLNSNLTGAGDTKASCESNSRTGQQCADHFAG